MFFARMANLRILFISTFLIKGFLLFSQELISAGGGFSQNNLFSVSSSFGELATETLTNDNKIVTQGFQQPEGIIIMSIKQIPELDYEISVFPNPTRDKVTLKVAAGSLDNMNFLLYDINGKLITSGKIETAESEIIFRNLLPAIYFLKILERRTELKIFKIVKH